MDGGDFLTVADALAAGNSEAEWRSAVSRAYYAAFHRARDLLRLCQFDVPGDERAHQYLERRLANAGLVDLITAGSRIGSLRRIRNWADYELDRPLDQATAVLRVQTASDLLPILKAAEEEPFRSRLTEAIRVYERDILKEDTWNA
jgi:uncharacterized protein (UPF0332 family)